jgi:hypothetical protein
VVKGTYVQSTKDTFLLTLRQRLAALNPARAVFLDGAQQPAVVAAENQPATAALPLPRVFYLRWGAVRAVAAGLAGSAQPLLALECAITYAAEDDAESGATRGRMLSELDRELLRICVPPHAAKLDATQEPPAALPSRIVWQTPELGDAAPAGAALERTARVTVFAFAEEKLA